MNGNQWVPKMVGKNTSKNCTAHIAHTHWHGPLISNKGLVAMKSSFRDSETSTEDYLKEHLQNILLLVQTGLSKGWQASISFNKAVQYSYKTRLW